MSKMKELSMAIDELRRCGEALIDVADSLKHPARWKRLLPSPYRLKRSALCWLKSPCRASARKSRR